MRLIFAGTPEFAREAMVALHAAGHEIVLVLTQPDRPAGRGMKLQASPVKQWALEHQAPVAQPRSLRLDGKYPEDAAAAREAAIFRQLALTGLVPHDEEVAAMVAAAAPATLVPGDTAWITKLAAARPYLFKAAEQKPGTASPAEIVAAGRTTVPAAPAAPAAPGAPRPNAHELSDDAWAKRKAELGIR